MSMKSVAKIPKKVEYFFPKVEYFLPTLFKKCGKNTQKVW